MSMFRKILVGVDDSAMSRAAFEIACALGRQHQARLVIQHVIEHPYDQSELDLLRPLMDEEQEIRAAQEKLRAAYAPPPALDVEYVAGLGRASTELLRTAEGLGCDLIVLGTHGRSGLGRLVMGSVAEEVLRESRCPVLTVRTPFPAATVCQTASPVTEAASVS